MSIEENLIPLFETILKVHVLPGCTDDLHKATIDEDFDLMTRLLVNGADPNRIDFHLTTPLDRAFAKYFSNNSRFMIKLLLRYKADPNMEFGCHPYKFPMQIITADDHKLFSLFVTKGFDVNRIDSQERTALHHCVMLQRYEIIHILLAAGVNINRQDLYGRTALHYAAMLQDINSLLILRLANADTTITDYEGKVPGSYITSFHINHSYVFNEAMPLQSICRHQIKMMVLRENNFKAIRHDKQSPASRIKHCLTPPAVPVNLLSLRAFKKLKI